MIDLLIYILICLLLSAFFSGMEIAFLSSNKLRIEIDNSDMSMSQRIIQYFTHNSDLYITTTLVGNNIVMVIYGILFSDLLDPVTKRLDVGVAGDLLFKTIISTLIILVFAEFLPKMVFRSRSNLFLKIFALPIYLFYLVFLPISYFSVALGKLLVRISIKSKGSSQEVKQFFNKIDLNNLLDEDEKSSLESSDVQEVQFFRNALDFSELKVRDCIVPRTDIVALSLDSSLECLNKKFVTTGLSRILIYKDSVDDIIGYVHSSSLFKNPSSIHEALSNVIIVPETLNILKLLNQFIRLHKSLAVVVDEFGVTAGLITMEDIIEEIFGEIEDEHDVIHLEEEELDKDHYRFSGRLNVDYLNSKYHLNLQENDEYETLAGYILFNYPDIPEKGTQIEIEGDKFVILKVAKARIEEVEMWKSEKHAQLIE